MQYENENMDELFRRAAENYPLDTSSKDWNKVLQALQTETGQPEVRQKNNRGRFLWLLLLLPMGLVCNRYLMQDNADEKSISSAAKQVAPAKSSSQAKKQSKTAKTSVAIGEKQKPEELVESSVGKTFTSKKQNSYFGDKGSITQKNISEKRLSKRSFVGKEKKIKYKDANVGQTGLLVTGVSVSNVPTDPSLLTSFIGNNSNLISHEPVSASSKMIADPNEIKTPKGQIRSKKFYIGAVIGLDVTTIKSQKVEDVGYDYGALIGYDLSWKWSIESGVLFAKKIYYSDGKYFNTSKIYMPTGSWIDDLSGNCKMIEVPLLAKYNFVGHRQSNWFSTLGLSSYFMTQENYTYNYYYGTSGPVPHKKQYNNSSTHLFSNISISGGYAHKLGNFADLRIEPYLKLPVSEIGIGSLPLFSTGLQVGLTKKF